MNNSKLNELNLTQRMIGEFSSSRGKYRSTSILNEMGWTSVPNVKEFSVKVNDWDLRWKEAGLNIKSKPTIQAKIFKSKSFDKYMSYQLRRLECKKNSPFDYFGIALKLMKFSKAFRMSAIHRIIPLWYINISVKRMIHINRKIDKLLSVLSRKFNHRRVYIPKGDSYRPLGVPTLEWRIALHMLNNFMFQFVKKQILPSQHGFVKGRGTMTAWREIMNKVIQSNYIFECDLKQFFPSIKHSVLLWRMIECGIPSYIREWIDGINCSTPILPKRKLLDETLTLDKEKDLKFNPLNARSAIWGVKPSSGDLFALKQKLNMFDKSRITNGLISKQIGLSYGVAQGSPISPLISILGLSEFLTKKVPSVSYADDPIFYNEKDFKIRSLPSSGIVLNEEKSFWVKRKGVWLKKLKYLGLVYDPITNTLSNSTRSKSAADPLTLTMEQVIRILKAFKIKGYEDDKHSIKNWSILLNSKVFGVIMAKLYNNSWDKIDSNITETKINKGSWSVLNGKVDSNGDIYIDPKLISTLALNDLPNYLRNPNYLKIRKIPSKDNKISINVTVPTQFPFAFLWD